MAPLSYVLPSFFQGSLLLSFSLFCLFSLFPSSYGSTFLPSPIFLWSHFYWFSGFPFRCIHPNLHNIFRRFHLFILSLIFTWTLSHSLIFAILKCRHFFVSLSHPLPSHLPLSPPNFPFSHPLPSNSSLPILPTLPSPPSSGNPLLIPFFSSVTSFSLSLPISFSLLQFPSFLSILYDPPPSPLFGLTNTFPAHLSPTCPALEALVLSRRNTMPYQSLSRPRPRTRRDGTPKLPRLLRPRWVSFVRARQTATPQY